MEKKRVSVIVPNYNGIEYLSPCLRSLQRQTYPAERIIVVDNGSTDGSIALLQRDFPDCVRIALPENTGFCGAVNRGIAASKEMDYVILLNNDTEAEEDFIAALVDAMEKDPRIFSAQAKMCQMHAPEKIDDAGDLYCALGWAFARGKGKAASAYGEPCAIFSSCAGAAIYDRHKLDIIGPFDELHFAYLEDTDIGWRARIEGYRNVFAPRAVVRHVGSASSGSIYNHFKVSNSSRNSIYLIYKNMPLLQILLNLPLLLIGFLIKALFFALKGYGRIYLTGIGKGFALCAGAGGRGKKVRFKMKNMPNYLKIQLALWINCLRRLVH